MTRTHDGDAASHSERDAENDSHTDTQPGTESHTEQHGSDTSERPETTAETDQADGSLTAADEAEEAGEERPADSGSEPCEDSSEATDSADAADIADAADAADPVDNDSEEPADSTGTDDAVETDDPTDAADDAEAPGRSRSDASSGERPAGSRRHRRSVGQMIIRGVGILTSIALAGAVGGLTWWGNAAPTAPTPQLEALSLAEPGASTTYVCPHAPTNTLRGTDVGAMESTTTLIPASGAEAIQSATYAGQAVPTDATTSLSTAEGGILSLVPADGQVANAVGSVTTLTQSGDLRGLTAAPCAQPAAMSWIVGGSIAAGSSAELRLTNPGTTPATAKVTLYGSIGLLSLPSNGEVTIPAGGSSSLTLETKGSQDPRIAVSIEADGGSVVPTLVTESLDGETPAGTDVITPGAAPATDLVVPGVEIVEPASQGEVPDATTGADSSDSPAVRIVNPGQAPATVSVTMLTKDGARPLAGAQSVTVDAGSVFDISLAGVPAGTYGVQVTSSAPVGAAVRMVRSAAEYPERSQALIHDQAWAQAALPGAADSGLLAVPRVSSLTSAVTVANSGNAATVTLSSLDGSWSQDVAVAKGSAVAVEVPAEVAAVRLSTGGQEGSSGASRTPSGLAAATIVTAQAGGSMAGTLISTIPAQPDAAVQAQRRILLG